MTQSPVKVLLLGATGPTGICALRELLHRQHPTVAYVRSPQKIPEDLSSNPLLEVVKGDVNDVEAMTKAITGCSAVISLLGPQIGSLKGLEHSFFGDVYKNSVFPAMRKHGIRRIFAMGTPSYEDPSDNWVWMRPLIHTFMPIFAKAAYMNIKNIAKTFTEDAHDIDWTVYRIAIIPGESDEASWRKDREGDVFVGYVGQSGWTNTQKRASLARWLVEAAESGLPAWVGYKDINDLGVYSLSLTDKCLSMIHDSLLATANTEGDDTAFHHRGT